MLNSGFRRIFRRFPSSPVSPLRGDITQPSSAAPPTRNPGCKRRTMFGGEHAWRPGLPPGRAVAAQYRFFAGVPFLDPADAQGGVSKSKTMARPHPGVPNGCRLYEPLDLGFGEAMPPCSSASGRRRVEMDAPTLQRKWRKSLDIEHLKRPLHASGIFSEQPFLAALLTFGIDRIMFSVDYPYAPNANGRDFLHGISLAPADMAKLTHKNADALLKQEIGAR